MEEEKSYIDAKKNSIWSWMFGGLALITALIFLFSDFLAALCLIIAALFVFPPAVRALQKKWGFKLSKKKKIIIGVMGVILFLFLIEGSDVKTFEIKIQKGDSDSEEVIEAGKMLTNIVNDFQDAQLNTIALLSVKFETTDKEEYLKYIKEVDAKWEKVEDSSKKLDKIIKKIPDESQASNSTFQIIKTAYAAYPEKIDFGDAMNEDFGDGEVDIKKEMFDAETAIEQAEVYKAKNPNSKAIKYLMEHMHITAKEARDKLEAYHQGAKHNWDSAAYMYDLASDTAKGIAYGSQVSLYVLGSYASFGAAAAAASESGVILGYMGAAWGTALGGVDIAIDIAEDITVVSTGKGSVAYQRNKDIMKRLNMIFGVANVGKMLVTGIPTFDGNDLQVADDLFAVQGLGTLGADLKARFSGDKLQLEVGEGVSFPKATPIQDIIKAYHKEGFEYNKVSLMISEDESGEITVKEVKNRSATESCTSDNGLVQLIEEGVNPLDIWWPACGRSKNSCEHIPNTCLYKGKCICESRYSVIPNDNNTLMGCITDEDWKLLIGKGLSEVSNNTTNDQCQTLRKYNQGYSDEFFYERYPYCRNAGPTNEFELGPELESFMEKAKSPKEEQKIKRYMKCDL